MSIAADLKRIAQVEAPTLPLPGSGQTWRRFRALSLWAAENLSLGRLAEGHVDALAILDEAGMKPVSGATYGVWAARTGSDGTTARQESDGWHLTGQKPFCSGNGVIDRALVTADAPDGYRLFDVTLDEHVVATHQDSWVAVGMADSLSDTLEFGGPSIPGNLAIGGPDFYLARPGFWVGAIGVAACWYGGAKALVDHVTDTLPPISSDLVMAEIGHAVAQVNAMRWLLENAAHSIDDDPYDTKGEGRMRAMVLRHAVQHGATQVLGHVAAAGGARPLCHDRSQAQRAADLYVYLAQHHGPQDAAEIGRLALSGAAWS